MPSRSPASPEYPPSPAAAADGALLAPGALTPPPPTRDLTPTPATREHGTGARRKDESSVDLGLERIARTVRAEQLAQAGSGRTFRMIRERDLLDIIEQLLDQVASKRQQQLEPAARKRLTQAAHDQLAQTVRVVKALQKDLDRVGGEAKELRQALQEERECAAGYRATIDELNRAQKSPTEPIDAPADELGRLERRLADRQTDSHSDEGRSRANRALRQQLQELKQDLQRQGEHARRYRRLAVAWQRRCEGALPADRIRAIAEELGRPIPPETRLSAEAIRDLLILAQRQLADRRLRLATTEAERDQASRHAQASARFRRRADELADRLATAESAIEQERSQRLDLLTERDQARQRSRALENRLLEAEQREQHLLLEQLELQATLIQAGIDLDEDGCRIVDEDDDEEAIAAQPAPRLHKAVESIEPVVARCQQASDRAQAVGANFGKELQRFTDILTRLTDELVKHDH